jgi:FlaA1/EpsC-like NDP-sugar epimerase
MLQENWYCLLVYFITIATMILRVKDVKTEKMNDLISLVMYLVALILWIIIVKTKKLMSLRVERFLIAFNHHAPSMIVISSLLFYLVVCLCTNRCIWIGVIVLSFLVCIWLTCLWYKRENKYTTSKEN